MNLNNFLLRCLTFFAIRRDPIPAWARPGRVSDPIADHPTGRLKSRRGVRATLRPPDHSPDDPPNPVGEPEELGRGCAAFITFASTSRRVRCGSARWIRSAHSSRRFMWEKVEPVIRGGEALAGGPRLAPQDPLEFVDYLAHHVPAAARAIR